MKLTQEQALQALQKLGVKDVEIIEDAEQSEFDMSSILTNVDETRTPIIKQKVEAELSDSITSSKMGELNGMFKRSLSKTFGIPRGQLDKFETVDEAVEHVKTSFSEQFEGDKAEMDAKYNELLTKFNKDIENKDNEWQTKYNQLHDEVETAKQIELLHERFKEAPITWDKMAAAKETLNYAKSKYDVKVEDGQIKYYEKGTNRLALNKDANEALKDSDIAREYLEPRNGWAKDMRDAQPKNLPPNTMPKTKVNPYQDGGINDKRNASIKAVEALREANKQ